LVIKEEFSMQHTKNDKSLVGTVKQLTRLVLGEDSLLGVKAKYYFQLLAQAIFGLLWLEGSSWKVIVDGKLRLNYDGLAYWVNQGSKYPVFGPYKWLIENFILPNIKVFLVGVFVAELMTGLLFITGKYVRLAGFLAFAQSIAIALSVLNAPHEWKWSYFMMMLISLMFFINPTKSKWSLKSR
jgi:hypothetical protein